MGRSRFTRQARARAWIAVITAMLLGTLGLAATWAAAPAMASTPAPLSITTTTPLTATAGSAFLAKLDATGGTKPYTWSLAGGTTLPAGLVLHAATGQISGTPTGPGGTVGFTAQVTDNEATPVSATAAQTITVTVNPLAVTTVSLPAATAGVAYSATLAATGGVTPYSWSLPDEPLPAGLTLHPASGLISGTPKAGGTFTFTAAVTDSETTPQTASAPQSLTVGVAGLVVTTGSTLPTVTSGVPYSVKLAAAGGITPYTWSLASGSLPAGLTLKTGGTLSGTTAVTGLDTITVRVSDAENPAVTATEALSLSVVTPMAVTASLPGANLNQSYDTSLQPSGGLGPYSYAITAGSLPPGLALQSDGEITGPPTAGGSYPFTVSVTDSENPPATVTQAETITVTVPAATPAVATTSIYQNPDQRGYYDDIVVGDPVAGQATVSGGNNPTGTVSFSLYDNSSCSGTPLFTDTETLSGGAASSIGYTTAAAGTDYWNAVYSGDASNNAASSGCDSSFTVSTPADLVLSPGNVIPVPIGATPQYGWDFSAPLNGTSPTTTFTITNIGGSSTPYPIALNSTGGLGFVGPANSTCGGPLAPGASCTFDFDFYSFGDCIYTLNGDLLTVADEHIPSPTTYFTLNMGGYCQEF